MKLLPQVRVHHPNVEVRDDLLGGSPLIRGSMVPVRRVWQWHRKGVSVATLVKRYPSLGWARILDALSFAYDNEELVEADLARERTAMDEDAIDAIDRDGSALPRGPQLVLPARGM